MHSGLKLEKALNFRDIGGYQSNVGGTVKQGKLFRSDSLANLAGKDIETILDLGVRTVIDLRTEYETTQGECRLKQTGKVEYNNISLIDNIYSQDHKSLENNIPKTMEELYIDLLDNSAKQIVCVFDTILEKSEKGIVYNCTAGKDRTGVISALILDLLGVSRQDIVDNYTITEELMEPTFKVVSEQYKKATGKTMPSYLFESKQESMEEFLDYLYENYTDAEGYLLEKGFGEEKIEALRKIYLELE